jgi:hypothetical protein
LMAQCISAQALNKNGSVVTESTVSTLKVGAVTYPNTKGTAGQVLTTDGSGTASWTSPSTGGLASVFDGTNLYLDDSYSGSVIYINGNNNYSLFNNAFSLPDGFTCTLINVYATGNGDSLYIYGSNNLFFYQIPNYSNSFQTNFINGVSGFNIRPGGTVKVNVISVNGEKRIYLTGDLMYNPA